MFELLGFAPLHEIRGDGEWGSSKTNEGHALGIKFGHAEPYRITDERNMHIRVISAQTINIGQGAEWLVDHRSASLFDRHARNEGLHRRDDVGEKDGGINPVTSNRLECDLGGKGGVHEHLVKRSSGSQRPVLRQGSTGLTHEPDGSSGAGLVGAGGEKGRISKCGSRGHAPIDPTGAPPRRLLTANRSLARAANRSPA